MARFDEEAEGVLVLDEPADEALDILEELICGLYGGKDVNDVAERGAELLRQKGRKTPW